MEGGEEGHENRLVLSQVRGDKDFPVALGAWAEASGLAAGPACSGAVTPSHDLPLSSLF